MKRFLGLILVMLFFTSVEAAPVYTRQDSLIYEKYVKQMNPQSNLPINQLFVKSALYFKDAPYVASTLDNGKKECLVVNLRQFDCTTLVETCIALSKTLKTSDHSFSNFCNQLQQVRYRSGEIEDYASRLHYMTDWVYDNARKGIFANKSKSLGGISDPKIINFMSNHIDAYKPLRGDMKLQKKIREIEEGINSRKGYYYIKKEDIRGIEDKVVDGDIVIFATSIQGLDYSHIGIACHEKGKLTFVHASTRAMKVIVEPQSLYDYYLKSTKCTGVTIVRLNE